MPKRETKTNPDTEQPNPSDKYWEKKQLLQKKGKKLFVQKIFADWCKACGICIAFCPANVFAENDRGMPVIKDPDACTGCRFCELHCPDFALSIQECYPDRRKRGNGV